MKYLDDLSQLGSSESIFIYSSGSYTKTLSNQISYLRKDKKMEIKWLYDNGLNKNCFNTTQLLLSEFFLYIK